MHPGSHAGGGWLISSSGMDDPIFETATTRLHRDAKTF
jgi:hypothetical protein